MNKYDIIVIGSGFGGLFAAATLAKHGLSVGVFEQYNRFGGFGQSYSLKNYIFDTAVHSIWFWEQLDTLLQSEFNTKLKAVPSRRNDHIIIGKEYDFRATSIPEMKEQIQKLIPRAADEVALYYDNLIQSQEGFVNFINNPQDMAARLKLVKYKELWRSTLKEAVHSIVTDEITRSLVFGYHDSYLYDYSWSYPAHHLYLTKYLYDGFQPVGGSQALVDAMVNIIKGYGGEMFTNALVTKIITDNNEAIGITLKAGEKIEAKKAVISNADAILTMEKMIGKENLSPHMVKQLEMWKKYVPSLSYYILNVGLDIDVRKTYGLTGDLTVYFPQTDVLKCLEKINSGILPDDFWLWAVFPSVNDSSLAPVGHSVAVLSVLVPYNCENYSHVVPGYFNGFEEQKNKGPDYYNFKKVITERILNRADEIFPGLSGHVVVKDLITPMTLERTTLNYKGSTLGFIINPELQKHSNRYVGVRRKSEINKLYFAGGWTEDGFSVPSVITSGREVAFAILGKPGLRITVDTKHRMERLR